MMIKKLFTETIIKRKISILKKSVVLCGKNKDYESIYNLLSEIDEKVFLSDSKYLVFLSHNNFIKFVNHASIFFLQEEMYDKYFLCFTFSLRIRSRQKQNLNVAIETCIKKWRLDMLIHFSSIAYDAYKHTRYLALKSLALNIVSEKVSESSGVRESIEVFKKNGRLKSFYLYYIKNKVFLDKEYHTSIYTFIKKGMNDPLISEFIGNYFTKVKDIPVKFDIRLVDLYIFVASDLRYNKFGLCIDCIYNVKDQLPDSEQRNLLVSIQKMDFSINFTHLKMSYMQLRLAYSRYIFIKILSEKVNFKDRHEFVDFFVDDIKHWKSTAFISKVFSLFFHLKLYSDLILLNSFLPDNLKSTPTIFNYYIGSLRYEDRIDVAYSELNSSSEVIPVYIKLSQRYYLAKYEKDYTKALSFARQVFNLVDCRSKLKWAFKIVEVYCAEGDFDEAFKFVSTFSDSSFPLLSFVHFKKGTLSEIEFDLLQSVSVDKGNEANYYYLAYLYCERKEYAKAKKYSRLSVDCNQSLRNCLLYVLILINVERDFASCINFIDQYRLDQDVTFAKYYVFSLLNIGLTFEAKNYLKEKEEIFFKSPNGSLELKLFSSNLARLCGDYEESFELFSSIFNSSFRCFTTNDNKEYSPSVEFLNSSALINVDESLPLISVIMTNFGWSKYTPIAIDSILKQTYHNLELVIVDDRSDKTAFRKLSRYIRKLKDNRVTLIRLKKNSGTYRAKNEGLSIVKGDFITFQDSDDWSHPKRLMEQYLVLIKNKKQSAVLTQYLRVNPMGEIHFQNSQIFRKAFITLMVKRSVIKQLGFFDSVRTSADSELIHRIEAYTGTSIGVINSPLYIASYHDRSLTSYGPFSLDPILGVVGYRKEYLFNFKKWHSKIKIGFSPYIEKWHQERNFPCPNPMLK
ncbi:glycosyltransferase family A protein [Shewanella gaetbuli]|uniref:Glycosyltransferase family 2 protein n=1 Tax=Shewanella gaetbuli TaxID=220752 RepID=A0A9X1ZIG7_9GAMM|nr:glycosyltransferase family A protein [Shewanella gaetbuli]MCL1142328.1 glycosyltransferase family 2 protein [Shewanella gaetbuli]